LLLSALGIAFCSFLLCFYSIPILVKLANRFNIYDQPNHIKKHIRKITFLGGAAILFSFLIPLSLLLPAEIKKPIYLNSYLILMVIIFFHGLGDDIFNYNPSKKFLIQGLLCGLLIYKTGLYIPFENMLDGWQLPSIVYVMLTLLAAMAVVNAYNLIDGSDGLAASISLIAGLFYAFYFFMDGNYFFFIAALGISASLLAFLLYNRPPAHIFMGDSGSLFIGMLLATFTFVFIENKTGAAGLSTSNRVILAFSFLSIPILDMVRLFIVRSYGGRNPFKGDNNHIHHLMENIGFTTKQTLLIITTFQLLNIGIAYLALNKSWIGFILISICVYTFLIQSLRQLKTYLSHREVKSINPTAESLEEDPTFERNVKVS